MIKLNRVMDLKAQYSELYKKLGLKISYYRKLKGLTQEELSEKIGKSTAFLGSVEAPNMDCAISLDTMFDIAAALEVAPYKFLVDD